MVESRPWQIPVNRAAYQRRHKLLVDGRLFLIIIPLACVALFGWFLDPRFIVFMGLALLVWALGVMLWQLDPWAITRALINLDSPRRGPGAKRNRP
jgi:hypothetical protein